METGDFLEDIPYPPTLALKKHGQLHYLGRRILLLCSDLLLQLRRVIIVNSEPIAYRAESLMDNAASY